VFISGKKHERMLERKQADNPIHYTDKQTKEEAVMFYGGK